MERVGNGRSPSGVWWRRRSGPLLLVALVAVVGPTVPAPAQASPMRATYPDDALLRATLAAADTDETTVIRLGPERLSQFVNEPLVIRHRVRIIGTGPATSVIDASFRGQIFRVEAGGSLELRSLAVIGGSRLAGSPASSGRVELTDVLIAQGLAAGSGDIGDYLQYCLDGKVRESQFFARATLTDPTSLGSLPGDPF